MSRRVIPGPMAPPPVVPAAPAPKAKMPMDRFAMMRQVNQEAMAMDNISAGQNHRERLQQESKRRAEVTLMEKEDYTFTQEGVDRLKRQEARLLMQEEDKRMRAIMKHEAAQRYQELERERKRIEAEERQRLLEKHKAEMEQQKREQEAQAEIKKREREERMRKMKEASDRRAREEYLANEAVKKAALESERILHQEQMERAQMEAEEEIQRQLMLKEKEEAEIQAKIAAEEAKWKAWEEAEAEREASEQATRRAQMAVQYEEDKKRRMELHRLRKETENRLKRIELMDNPLPSPPKPKHSQVAKSVPKIGSFCLNPTVEKPVATEFKDIATMTKEQLKEEHNTCVQHKKTIKGDIVAWCDACEAKLGRPPTLEEKQEIQPLYKRYSDMEAHLRSVKHRLEQIAAEEKAKRNQNSVFQQLSAKAKEQPKPSALTASLNEVTPVSEVDRLTLRKKEVKKEIQTWCTEFQKAHGGRAPTVADKKQIQALYEEYAQIDAKLKELKYSVETLVTTEAAQVSAEPAPEPATAKTLPGLVSSIHDSLDEKDKSGAYNPRSVAECILALHERMDSQQCIAFLKVDGVEADSPAAFAGLQIGDLIGRFGVVLKCKGVIPSTSLIREVVATVNARVGRGISISLLRDDSPKSWRHLVLKPQKWRGKGLLGCVLQPYEPPAPADPSQQSSPTTASEVDRAVQLTPAPASYTALCVELPQSISLSDLIIWHHKVLDVQDTLSQEVKSEASPRLASTLGAITDRMHSIMLDMNAIPFLKVEGVEASSPAEGAGLQPGDLLGRMGSVIYYNGSTHASLIKEVVALVNDRVNRGISISIFRNDTTWKALVLRPHRWKGQGLLGCILHPFDPSDAVKRKTLSVRLSSVPSIKIPPEPAPIGTLTDLPPSTGTESSTLASFQLSNEKCIAEEAEEGNLTTSCTTHSSSMTASDDQSQSEQKLEVANSVNMSQATEPTICEPALNSPSEVNVAPSSLNAEQSMEAEENEHATSSNTENILTIETEAAIFQDDASRLRVENPHALQDEIPMNGEAQGKDVKINKNEEKSTPAVDDKESHFEIDHGDIEDQSKQQDLIEYSHTIETTPVLDEITRGEVEAASLESSSTVSQEPCLSMEPKVPQEINQIEAAEDVGSVLDIGNGKNEAEVQQPVSADENNSADCLEQPVAADTDQVTVADEGGKMDTVARELIEAEKEDSSIPVRDADDGNQPEADATEHPDSSILNDDNTLIDETATLSSNEVESNSMKEAEHTTIDDDLVKITPDTTELETAFHFPKEAFAVFEDVTSCALEAGLQDNDYLVHFDGMHEIVSATATIDAFLKVTAFPLSIRISRWIENQYVMINLLLGSWDGVNLVLPIQHAESWTEPSNELEPIDHGGSFAQVNAVYDNSPADHGGLMVGDLVFWITDLPEDPTLESVSNWIGNAYSSSQSVEIHIYRYSEDEAMYDEIKLQITPDRWCDPQLHLSSIVRRHVELLGWDLVFFNTSVATPIYPSILLVEDVSVDSPAQEGGLISGDLIGKIGQVFNADQDVSAEVYLYIDRPMPLQVSRYEATSQKLQTFDLSVTPQSWLGDGLLGCQLTPWPLSDLAPFLVANQLVPESDSNGLLEGDLLLRVGPFAHLALLEEVANYLNNMVCTLLIVQRWQAQEMLYTIFPILIPKNTTATQVVDDSICIAGYKCITYETYWKSYEDAHPSELPCKECWSSTFNTVAHAAAYFGHVACLGYLGEYFDVYIVDDLGRTPLFYACYANQLECVQLLLTLDYSNARESIDVNGDTPLHAATSGGALAVMEYLLQEGCSSEPINYSGFTRSLFTSSRTNRMRPVHIAPSVEALKVLAAGQADLVALDGNSRLALAYACMAGDEASVKYLVAECTEFIDYPDSEGDTPMHFAVSGGFLSCVESILQAKKDSKYVLRPNKAMQTALDIAHNKGLGEIVAILEDNCDNNEAIEEH